jgi:hypothetical protein
VGEILQFRRPARPARGSDAAPASRQASSAIRGIDYDAPARELHVTFASGKAYRYFGVPPQLHAAFVAAASKGGFFNAHIRDAFRFAEVKKT